MFWIWAPLQEWQPRKKSTKPSVEDGAHAHDAPGGTVDSAPQHPGPVVVNGSAVDGPPLSSVTVPGFEEPLLAQPVEPSDSINDELEALMDGLEQERRSQAAESNNRPSRAVSTEVGCFCQISSSMVLFAIFTKFLCSKHGWHHIYNLLVHTMYRLIYIASIGHVVVSVWMFFGVMGTWTVPSSHGRFLLYIYTWFWWCL